MLQYNVCSMCDNICVEISAAGSRESSDQTCNKDKTLVEEIWLVNELLLHIYVRGGLCCKCM